MFLTPFSRNRNYVDIFDDPFFKPKKQDNNFGFAACDLIKKDNSYELHCDLPGMAKDNINIDINGNTLKVSGERKNEHSEDTEGGHYFERSYGSFQRSITLPKNADKDSISADFKDGVLLVNIPTKVNDEPSKRIVGRQIYIFSSGVLNHSC